MNKIIKIKGIEMSEEEYTKICIDIVKKEPWKLEFIKYPNDKIIKAAIEAGGIKIINLLTI